MTDKDQLSEDDRVAIFDTVRLAVERAGEPWLDQEPVATLFRRVFVDHAEAGLFYACGALAMMWRAAMDEMVPGYEVGADLERPPFYVVTPDGVVDPDSTGVPQVDVAVWAIRFAHAWSRGDVAMGVALYGAAVELCDFDADPFSDYLHALLDLACSAESEVRRRDSGVPILRLDEIVKLWADPPAEP